MAGAVVAIIVWIILGLAFWEVLSIVIAFNMAKRRNRSKIGWAIWTFFFGWFAVLVLWPLGAKHMKKCPQCQMSIPESAVKCGHCQADLTSVPPAL